MGAVLIQVNLASKCNPFERLYLRLNLRLKPLLDFWLSE